MISILGRVLLSDLSDNKRIALGDRTDRVSLDDDEGANSNSFDSCVFLQL